MPTTDYYSDYIYTDSATTTTTPTTDSSTCAGIPFISMWDTSAVQPTINMDTYTLPPDDPNKIRMGWKSYEILGHSDYYHNMIIPYDSSIDKEIKDDRIKSRFEILDLR